MPPPINTPENSLSSMQEFQGMFPSKAQNEGHLMLRQLLNNEAIPDDFKIKFWHLLPDDITLGFQDDASILTQLAGFDIMFYDELFDKPYFQYNWKLEQDYGKARHIFNLKLRRAVGMKGTTTKNERTLQTTQFQEQTNVLDDKSQQLNRGFMGLFGKRR